MTTKYSDFWTWFQQNAPKFPSTEEFDARFGDELSRQLARIKPGLVYEIAVSENGSGELGISADGLRDLIPYVKELVQAAPSLDGWRFTAFRPRMDDYAGFRLNMGGLEIDAGKLWCYSRVEDGHFDLIIYHPEYSDEMRDKLVNGTYILLDTALGEYHVMTEVRYIDLQQLPADPEAAGLYRFEKLRQVLDDYRKNK